MENFTVKTINSVDYVKAMEVADFYGKNKNNACRFIRNTFSEQDIAKTNATLYVKKLAVELHFSKQNKLVDEKEILEYRKAKEHCIEIANLVEKKYHQYAQVYSRLDEQTLLEIHSYISGECEEPFPEFIRKKLKLLHQIFSPKIV